MIFSKKLPASKSSLKLIPETAGVYAFFDINHIIYIGKAINLKSRLSSYFSETLIGKTKFMMNKAKYFSFIKVSNEIEALLLEANLVRQNLPAYNVQLRDDKHALYITITKEAYPRILTSRKTGKFGPYPSSSQVKMLLKYLKKYIPYATHKPGKRACLDHQLGLCNPCPSLIKTKAEKDIYLQHIKTISKILSGKYSLLEQYLRDQITIYAKQQDYEKAQEIKQKLDALVYIGNKNARPDVFLNNPNFESDLRQEEIKQTLSLLKNYFNITGLNRVECYDIAHISGKYTSSSMVVAINGEVEKKAYRHFKIKGSFKANDEAAMIETISRRLKHLKDWGKPDLIIVDGGKGQVSAIYPLLKPKNIPVIGLAKLYETIIVPVEENRKIRYIEIRAVGSIKNLLVRIRNEAHRFARRYHHLLISKSIRNIYEDNS